MNTRQNKACASYRFCSDSINKNQKAILRALSSQLCNHVDIPSSQEKHTATDWTRTELIQLQLNFSWQLASPASSYLPLLLLSWLAILDLQPVPDEIVIGVSQLIVGARFAALLGNISAVGDESLLRRRKRLGMRRVLKRLMTLPAMFSTFRLLKEKQQNYRLRMRKGAAKSSVRRQDCEQLLR